MIFSIHERLGERRLVALVVAVAAVADHVDHHVFAEGLAKVECQLADVDDGFGILAVDVEDRHLDHLGDVGAIPGRSALAGGRREADLIVDDDVDGAAGPIARQLREVQGFSDQPLPCKSGVAVNQDRDAEPAVAILESALLGPHSSLDDRIDGFQVAGVGREREMDRVLVGCHVVGRETEVVLDVSITADGFGQVVAFEFVEDHSVRLVEDVCQHVQPTAVRHAHDNLAHARRARSLDHGVEQRDQHLAAFEREPLLTDVVFLKERLEELGRVELVDDAAASSWRRAAGDCGSAPSDRAATFGSMCRECA